MGINMVCYWEWGQSPTVAISFFNIKWDYHVVYQK